MRWHQFWVISLIERITLQLTGDPRQEIANRGSPASMRGSQSDRSCYNPPADYKVLANGSTCWPIGWTWWIGQPTGQRVDPLANRSIFTTHSPRTKIAGPSAKNFSCPYNDYCAWMAKRVEDEVEKAKNALRKAEIAVGKSQLRTRSGVAHR